MPLDQPTSLDMNSSTERASPQRMLWRFFAGWRRLEEAIDYGPFNYTNDRLREFEVRIEQLERKLAAALSDPIAPTLRSTVSATSSDHR